MNLSRKIHAAAAVVVVYAAGSSAFFLYRLPSLRIGKHPLPIATLSLIAITGVVTGLQFIFPEVLSTLRRRPDAFSTYEWWRLATPMFVQADGWPQVIFNFTGLGVVGPVVEWRFGSHRWLVLYFVPSLIGEIGGYFWDPTGAGSSLPLAGLTGSLFVWLLLPHKALPRITRVLGALGLLGGVTLAAVRDIHGPPLIAGACLAVLLLWRKSGTNYDLQQD